MTWEDAACAIARLRACADHLEFLYGPGTNEPRGVFTEGDAQKMIDAAASPSLTLEQGGFILGAIISVREFDTTLKRELVAAVMKACGK